MAFHFASSAFTVPLFSHPLHCQFRCGRWLFGFLAFWLFGFLAFWLLAFWLFGFLAFWLFGFLAFWLFGFLAFWLFGFLAFWLFGFLAFWLFGFLAFLAFWLFGFLAFWLFGFLAFGFLAFGGFLALAFRILMLSQLVFGLGFLHPQHRKFLSGPPATPLSIKMHAYIIESSLFRSSCDSYFLDSVPLFFRSSWGGVCLPVFESSLVP